MSARIPAALLGSFFFATAALTAPSPTLERTFFAMGTRFEIAIHNESRENALSVSEAAYRAVQDAEKRLSTWTEESELSRLNRLPKDGSAVVSSSLARDLKSALSCAEKTDFAFNPWIGPLVKAWGLRKGGKIPSEAERIGALAAAQNGAFGIEDRRIIKKLSDAAFEEGGFGKGIGLDDAVSALKGHGVTQAVLNFGGQISIFGKTSTVIEVSDPSERSRSLLRFSMNEGSVATSGNSEHGMKIGNRKIGHLLNPFTGFPASYDGSVTVIAQSGASADCQSKVFVMGADKGLNWARRTGTEVLWIEPAPKNPRGKRWIARPSCAWKHPLETMSADVEIRNDCKTKMERET